MPDPSWPSSPPEVNYLRLAGAGAAGTATTLASGAAWQAVAVSAEAAGVVSAGNAVAVAADFEGVGGAASTATVTGLNSALHLLGGWAQAKPPIAASAVAAYETAVSSMIPAEVAIANRTEQAADVAINPLVFGALTPAIVALDAAYFGEYWPHNASAGIAYGTALSGLTAALALPPPPSPPGASPAAPAAAAAAITQSAGQAAAGEALQQSAGLANTAGNVAAAPAQAIGQVGQLGSSVGQPLQAALGSPQAVMGMFQTPLRGFGGVAGLMPSAIGGMGSTRSLDELATFGITDPMLAGVGGVPVSAGAAGVVAASAGAGPAGAAAGIPGAGLTSYARPTTNFSSENSGRPVALKTGLLSAAEFRGPVGTAVGGGIPVAPVAAPPPAIPRSGERDSAGHARVVVGPLQPRRS